MTYLEWLRPVIGDVSEPDGSEGILEQIGLAFSHTYVTMITVLAAPIYGIVLLTRLWKKWKVSGP